MTGTPEGISPVEEGDHLVATLTYEGRVIAKIEDIIKRE